MQRNNGCHVVTLILWTAFTDPMQMAFGLLTNA